MVAAPDTIPSPPPVHTCPCPNCDGTGRVNLLVAGYFCPEYSADVCMTCNGSGELEAYELAEGE
jgi:DnaJ-class molecular chaperone